MVLCWIESDLSPRNRIVSSLKVISLKLVFKVKVPSSYFKVFIAHSFPLRLPSLEFSKPCFDF